MTGGAKRGYDCFGQVLGTTLDLPELDRADGVPTLTLDLREGDAPGAVERMRYEPDVQRLRFDGVASFDVERDDRLSVTAPKALWPVLGLPLLGPVMATLLHRQGRFVLHGSGLVVDGAVHLLLGDRGAGKSTTAAALIAAGLTLATDDIAGVSAEGPVTVLTGYPGLKIAPEVADALLPDVQRLGTGGFPFPKARLRLERPTLPPALPLGAMWLLARGEGAHKARRLSQVEAVPELMRHSYMLKYGNVPFADGRNGRHFARAAEIARQVPLGALRVADGIDRIAGVLDLMREGV